MRSSILVTFLLANLTLAHPFSSPAKRQSSPSGPRTDTILRPKVGSVPYGGDFGGVQHCSNGKVALTFDDGPYIWTHDLLDLLDRYGAKATFFISEYTDIE
jgi:peptidoglycan/xylan/chitin deacetylase (PgdA/CDA1 family)